MNDVMIVTAIGITGLMTVMWLISIPLRNVSIVDIGWGLGFVLVAWLAEFAGASTSHEGAERSFVSGLTVLVTVWGLRLSLHLARRNIGHGEDYRYREMRERRGRSFVWSSFFIVFALQGAVMWLVSLPIQAAASWPVEHPAGYWAEAGANWHQLALLVWSTGFLCESLGDWQLARFKANPANKGRVMNRGLWRYTRHPNYFGDSVVWWGHWLIAMSVTDPRQTWWTIISPIVMNFLLVKVSGVALLEKSLRQRSPEYAAYIDTTSAFIPWFPRQHSEQKPPESPS